MIFNCDLHMCSNWSNLCVPVVTVHSCVHVCVWHMANSSIAPVVQTPYIMLQCGRNHVGAFLPHHEVPPRWPAELQQWPLRFVQGESQSVPLACTGSPLFKISFESKCCPVFELFLELFQCLTKITFICLRFFFHRVMLLRLCTPCGLKPASWRRASCSVCAMWTPLWRATQPL